MNIHEYQAKEVLKRYGVTVLDGQIAWTPEEAEAAAARLPGPVFVVNSPMIPMARAACASPAPPRR
jgi:succinyl-CoA synthetase beta subunit